MKILKVKLPLIARNNNQLTTTTTKKGFLFAT